MATTSTSASGYGVSSTGVSSECSDWVNKKITDNTIVLFTKSDCANCDRAKKVLSEASASYKEVNESDCKSKDSAEFNSCLSRISQGKGFQLPLLFINGQCVGGISEIESLNQSGRLREMVKDAGGQTLMGKMSEGLKDMGHSIQQAFGGSSEADADKDRIKAGHVSSSSNPAGTSTFSGSTSHPTSGLGASSTSYPVGQSYSGSGPHASGTSGSSGLAGAGLSGSSGLGSSSYTGGQSGLSGSSGLHGSSSIGSSGLQGSSSIGSSGLHSSSTAGSSGLGSSSYAGNQSGLSGSSGLHGSSSIGSSGLQGSSSLGSSGLHSSTTAGSSGLGQSGLSGSSGLGSSSQNTSSGLGTSSTMKTSGLGASGSTYSQQHQQSGINSSGSRTGSTQ